MINILIIEDCEIQRKALATILLNTNLDLKIYEADNKDEALRISKSVNIDLFFVDINLKNSSGLDFALEIRKLNKYRMSWIIFTTTYVNYMIEAFKEVHCYDYILKPYEPEKIVELTKLIVENKYKKTNETDLGKKVTFNNKGLQIVIDTANIIFLEVSLRKCIIHTKFGEFVIKGLTLKKALEIICDPFFIQCHKSFIINVNYIEKIEKYSYTSWKVHFQNYKPNAFIGLKYKKLIDEKLNALSNKEET